MSHLAVESLTFGYTAGEPVLSNLTFRHDSCGILAILGTSGIGKSTLLKVLAGIYQKDDESGIELEGSIRLNGKPPKECRGPLQLGMMFQHAALLDHLSVEENIRLPTRLADFPDVESELQLLLDVLGLLDERDKKPQELSGGMKTRAALARALICRPTCLFLDEPFAGIDLLHRLELYRIVRERRENPDLLTVIATHDIDEVVLLASRIIVLGRKGGEASSVDLIDNNPVERRKRTPEEWLAEARERSTPVLCALASDE